MSALRVFFVGVCVTVCLCSYTLRAHSQGNTTNKGTEFWTAWMTHVSGVTGTSPSRMVLYITSDVSSTGTVSLADGSFSQNFNITANQVTPVDIPTTAFLTSYGTYLKGIHIVAAKPIVVYAHIYANNVSGATLVLPVTALAKDYYSINYKQQSNSANSYSAFNVIATEDNTTVQITPSATMLDGKAAGQPYEITLNKGQVYQGLSNTDLTHTRIQSISKGTDGCKRIAVFSGSGKVYIGCTPSAVSSDNLFQQVYPTASWGRNYITAPMASRAYDVYRIIYTDATANVIVNGTPIPSSALVNNTYYEFTSTSPNVISSDKPIQVVQYAVTQYNGLNCTRVNETAGDPEMIFLTPIEQGLDHITLYSTDRYKIISSYINVIIPTAAAGTFTIDGNPYTQFSPVNGNPGYSYAQISVAAGTHTIAAGDAFNAIAYGFGSAESYGYAAGTNLKDLNQYIVLDDNAKHMATTNACTNQTYDLRLTVPYKTTQIKWDLKDGSAMYTDNSPAVIATTLSKDGTQTLYTYGYNKTLSFSAGDHTVVASVFNPIADECGSFDDVQFDFNVSEPPNAQFKWPATACLNGGASFTDASTTSSGTIKTWLWDFGDGTTSTEQNPVHAYAKAGDYQVVLTAGNDGGCSSVSAPQTVHVTQQPAAAFSVSPVDCETRNVTFTDASTTPEGNITQWVWNFGDGSPAETHNDNKPVTHKFSTAQTYTVTLQVSNSLGCSSDITTQQVVVNPLPQAEFTLPDACIADQAQFHNTSTIANGTVDDLTYLWDFGDPHAGAGNANTSTEKNPKHRYSEPRDESNPYVVTLTVTSKSGCVSAATAHKFVVNGSSPKAAFLVTNKDHLCSSDLVEFDAGQSGVAFGNITKIKFWFDYDGDKSDTAAYYYSRSQIPANRKFYHQYKLFNAPLTKTYRVYMEVSTGLNTGCVDAIDQTIMLNANPLITVTGPGTICANSGAVQIATQLNGFNGTGTFSGQGVSSSGMFDPAAVSPGTYNIAYHFTTTTGCSYDAAVQVIVKPVPVVTTDAETSLLSGGVTRLNATASISDHTPLTYKWVPATGLERDDVLNPMAGPANDTKYTLYVYSQSNCVASSKTTVRVLQAPVIPNTFTPNSDGVNDKWEIKYLDSYTKCTVEVFNRNGEKVYSSVGYPTPWDGRYKGADLPVGTYYYIINPRNGRKVMAGWITILR